MVLIQLDFVVLLLFCWTFTGATVPEGLSRILLGSYTNIKTIQLLNQLCNQSQNKDLVSRDACYGCFFRATSRPSGYPMLLAMSSCAETYLDDDDYGHCQTYLKNATINIESKANPPTIYCTFLECVRQVNKDALIRVCAGEAIRIFSNFTVNDVQLAQLFVNTTACILAKTRCGALNPITGVYQEDDIATKLAIPSINAILVNSNYDINIVQLPFGSNSVDECTKYKSIEQASWPGVQC